jgi:triosephosphate isomerase (TIM)
VKADEMRLGPLLEGVCQYVLVGQYERRILSSEKDAIVAHMRETLASLFSPRVAEQARLIYGSSVNPRNIAEIAAEDSIDGVLTGAASLNAANFTTIVRAFARPG